jgi:N-formylglutamate deformylase
MTQENLIFHVPHSSTCIPIRYRSQFCLSDALLFEEILLMTDWHTADLFAAAIDGLGQSIEFPVSRLLVDPERFPDDEQESMAKVGMGVLYEKTSRGKSIREARYLVGSYRDRLLADYYYPHHEAFEKLVEAELNRRNNALIVDCHSFPGAPLPYELDQNPDRPDICIGADEFHTPEQLSENLKKAFARKGYRVKINAPFSGSIVPLNFYKTNPNVASVMIEINRALYMNEETSEKTSNFKIVGEDVASALTEATGVAQR